MKHTLFLCALIINSYMYAASSYNTSPILPTNNGPTTKHMREEPSHITPNWQQDPCATIGHTATHCCFPTHDAITTSHTTRISQAKATTRYARACTLCNTTLGCFAPSPITFACLFTGCVYATLTPAESYIHWLKEQKKIHDN